MDQKLVLVWILTSWYLCRLWFFFLEISHQVSDHFQTSPLLTLESLVCDKGPEVSSSWKRINKIASKAGYNTGPNKSQCQVFCFEGSVVVLNTPFLHFKSVESPIGRVALISEGVKYIEKGMREGTKLLRWPTKTAATRLTLGNNPCFLGPPHGRIYLRPVR